MLILLLIMATQLWLTPPTSASNELVDLSKMFGPCPRCGLPFPELVKHDGNVSETHYVITKDGYILTIFRVLPKGPAKDGPPFVFVHGLYLCADDCIIPGPGKAHCYIYSQKGYEVWVPNVRGNKHSRNHTKYNPDKDLKFWDFSFDDMAQNDLSAIFDYILKATGKDKVNYVARSQGVTILLLLCVKQPIYNKVIDKAFGLSTAAWLYNSKLFILFIQGVLSPVLTAAVNIGLNTEIFPFGGLTQEAAKHLCGLTKLEYPLCSLLIFAIFGYNAYDVSNETLPVAVCHEPAGTSLKNFNRWSTIVTNGFTEYDYGPIENVLKYGQVTPPVYNLTLVDIDIILVTGPSDCVCDVRDLKLLVPHVKNCKTCIVSSSTFGHIDHIYGDGITKYIIPIIFSAIEEHKFVCP